LIRVPTVVEELEHVVDLEADLVRVLAGVLVQGPAAGALRLRPRLGGRRRSLADAPLPLLPVTQERSIKEFRDGLVEVRSVKPQRTF